MQVKKQQLGLDMKQQTGCNLGKEYIKAIYCHTAYLAGRNINNLRYADDITLMAERRGIKEPLHEGEREE